MLLLPSRGAAADIMRSLISQAVMRSGGRRLAWTAPLFDYFFAHELVHDLSSQV
jgi:hypothetical protein